MSDILCVTQRALCGDGFLPQLTRIASAAPAAIILREKDLPEADYVRLAEQVLAICRKAQVPCVLHTYADAAARLGAGALHMPLPLLRALRPEQKAQFPVLGASCHSPSEAVEAERLGCTYITAGHVFATDCKKGLPPRGLDFLREVCAAVSIPVYAIGGITAERMPQVWKAGAAGACVMSGLMRCDDPVRFLKGFE